MGKKTVQYCTDNSLCCSCGFCADICPTNAITITEKRHLFTPSVDYSKCVKCGLCYDLCAGKGNEWFKKCSDIIENQQIQTEYTEDLGFHSKCYVAHSSDDDLRFHCASGGVVTTLLLYMLRTKLIDGAIVTRFAKGNPLAVETIIATTEQEIIEAKSSKYCPVHMDGIIRQLKNFEGKVAFVGLPCQIQTLRNIEDKHSWLINKVILHIGLYCSGGKDTRALNYLLKKNGFKREGIKTFAYRDDGCLGYVKATYDTEKDNKSVPYAQAYNLLHSYFKPERCVQCIDHFAYLADISIGDIDCEPYNKDTIGSNSLIIRTDIANKIFAECVENKDIVSEIISVEEVVRSQKIMPLRKSLFSAYTSFRKLFFCSIPQYDKLPVSTGGFEGLKRLMLYVLQRLFCKLFFK